MPIGGLCETETVRFSLPDRENVSAPTPVPQLSYRESIVQRLGGLMLACVSSQSLHSLYDVQL
jgi:hypothetical protein